MQLACWLRVIEKKNKKREEIAFIVPSGLNEKGDGLGKREGKKGDEFTRNEN